LEEPRNSRKKRKRRKEIAYSLSELARSKEGRKRKREEGKGGETCSRKVSRSLYVTDRNGEKKGRRRKKRGKKKKENSDIPFGLANDRKARDEKKRKKGTMNVRRPHPPKEKKKGKKKREPYLKTPSMPVPVRGQGGKREKKINSRPASL